MTAFDSMQEVKRKAFRSVDGFQWAYWVMEPMIALSLQADAAEREAIRVWNERRFFRALRQMARELETM